MSDSRRNANDDDGSPPPFRRERNLSNRNFSKRGSRRYYSTESHSSVESLSISTTSPSAASTPSNETSSIVETKQRPTTFHNSNSSSSSMQISYSVNSDTENAFNHKSLLKMLPPNNTSTNSDHNSNTEQQHQIENNTSEITAKLNSPVLEDPALLDVRQKVKRFETLKIEEITNTTTTTTTATKKTVNKLKVHTIQKTNGVQNQQYAIGPLRVLPVLNRLRPIGSDVNINSSRASTTSPSLHTSIDEERSEDEVDDISDFEDNTSRPNSGYAGEYILPEEAIEIKEDTILPAQPGDDDDDADGGGGGDGDGVGDFGEIKNTVRELSIDDFGKVESVRRSCSVESSSSLSSSVQNPAIGSNDIQSHKQSSATDEDQPTAPKRDFKRNYRSTPRPKTEIIGIKNHAVVGKFNSLTYPAKQSAPTTPCNEEEEEPELRNKSIKVIEPILEELIKTEETYVEKLFSGIANYGNIFQRRDLPVGLRGKKYVLFGNIEQIAEFHRDEFLPMLQRNRHDLQNLFEEFQCLIDQNCLYGYVIYTMNKQRSLKLCDVYKNYFKLIQTELDDKLGINSFLVQPIQRMARYPLLLQQFITTLFKHRESVKKSLIEACCRLEKKLRTLLTTTNESEIINDIVDCNEFNVFYQGKFRKVSEFQIVDLSRKRTYRGKVFIFDKCIIYTEIKGKNLVFHGRYPCEHVGIVSKTKNFTLFYERRKQQECDFHGDPLLIEQWIELIRDMVNSYVTEEKLKLQERYSRENDHLHRKPPSLSLFRDSNRFSSDSGIGNIWVMPKPEANEEIVNNRTTWYAIS